MMCSIRKCKSRSVKGGAIKFFSFPKELSLANEWLRHCGPKTTAKNGRVCSNHFVPSDYSKPLRCILLNYSPKHARQLKPDAVPTLHLDSIDKQNTSKVNIKNETIHTTENMEILSQCNATTTPATEVAGSSEVIEKRPIKDKQNSSNVKVEIEIIPNTENIQNCLPQTIPATGVAELYRVLMKRPINDKQNTPNVSVEGENQIVLTTENMNCLPQYNTKTANEVAGSSEVIENRPIKDIQNTPNVKIEIVHNTENMDCLPQYTAIPSNGVVGLYEAVEERPTNDKQNIPNVTVEGENRIILTAENMNCLPQFITIPANEVAGLSKVINERPTNDEQNTPNLTVEGENRTIHTAENMNCLPQFMTIQANEVAGSSKVIDKSDEAFTISHAEYKAFIRNTNELKNLKKNLAKMFTSGQIRCLTNPTRHRVKWSAEDIAAAISLRRKSPQGYRFMRVTVGIPFPGCSTLRKWEAKRKIREGLLENTVKIDHTYAE